MAALFLPCGDTGLTVQFGEGIDRDLNQRIIRIRAAVDEAAIPGVIETVPTYRSLMIHYDPLRTSQAEIVEALAPLLAPTSDDGAATGKHWRMPVCFDGEEFAADMAHVAEWANMAPAAIIDIMTSVTHYVYMLGFAPGLPYMGDLPESLAIPRRKDPRHGVPPGSVLIATGLTVIYPVTNATGWHIIGRTPVPLFDVTADDPVLLTPGDTMTLYRVNEADFRAIEERVRAGTFEPERISTA
ncbi:MAG: 5-oxoprolinase subunit PxpB [Rhodospirillales bacterium]|jgi:inhibitor of KinA|nr:5-oxoprolinase subunit PxpB [Rhodospirillales bacterium]